MFSKKSRPLIAGIDDLGPDIPEEDTLKISKRSRIRIPTLKALRRLEVRQNNNIRDIEENNIRLVKQGKRELTLPKRLSASERRSLKAGLMFHKILPQSGGKFGFKSNQKFTKDLRGGDILKRLKTIPKKDQDQIVQNIFNIKGKR